MYRDRSVSRRRLLAAAGAVATPLAAGCSASGPDSDPNPTVGVNEMGVTKRRVDVDPGATVTWRNVGARYHVLVDDRFETAGTHEAAADWEFDLPLDEGDEGSYTFEDPGVYEYKCDLHGAGSGCGVVLVGGAQLNKPLPCMAGREV